MFLWLAALIVFIGHIAATAYQRATIMRPSATVSSVQRYVWRSFAAGLLLWGYRYAPFASVLAAWATHVLRATRRAASLLALLPHAHLPHRAFALSCSLLD
ncbi:MAG: hypothetical protein R2873_16630 [Caldilineaceae bacterium]|nr:hypothetical protein [Caldilineaceae bacterium]